MASSNDASFLRPRARLLHTIGAELISSERVALVELVKNAYDADASTVVLRFEGDLRPGHGSLLVLDDGSGMSADDIRATWLEIATPNRKRRTRSALRHRRVLGEKGIGRFAAARLAENMILTSRKEDSPEVELALNWTDFTNENAFLDEITVDWVERPPSVFATTNLPSLWQGIDVDLRAHGTAIVLEKLTSTWDDSTLAPLVRDLARLRYARNGSVHESDDFEIYLDLPEAFNKFSGPVAAPAALEKAPYRLRGSIAADGTAQLHRTLLGADDEITKRINEANSALRCGPFDIDLRVWDRDAKALADTSGDLAVGEFRRLLDEAAGVSIYRDGFRVLPYGEVGDDWLNLDRRRIQNPSLRISNNQVIGEVSIDMERNPELRDQSNREGLIHGPAFEDLRAAVQAVLALLEAERFRIRRERKPVRRDPTSIFDRFSLDDILTAVHSRHPADEQLVQLIESRERDISAGLETVQETLSRFSRLATIGRLIDEISHDGRHFLGLIRAQAKFALSAVAKAAVPDPKIAKRLEEIDAQASRLDDLFRRIAPFGGRKRGKPKASRLEDQVSNVLELLKSRLEKDGITVEMSSGDTIVTLDEGEVQQVLLNLIDNAIYWMQRVPRESRTLRITTNRVSDGSVDLIVSDTGPGVPEEVQELIFEPYFSEKNEGTGLGLALAGTIVADYYDGELSLIASELGGASFKAHFGRRV